MRNTGSPKTPSTATTRLLFALESLRRAVDGLDEQIVALLAQRYATVQSMVVIKEAAVLPIYHPAREEDLICQRRAQARRVGLDPDLVEELYRCIIRHSRISQTAGAAKTDAHVR